MLDKFKELLKSEKKGDFPKHISITSQGINVWADKNKTTVKMGFEKGFENLKEIVKEQIKQNIPVLTIYLLSEHWKEDNEKFSEVMDSFTEFFRMFAIHELVHNNKIKISVLGKWYDLPGRVVDPIRKMIDETKNYDSYFVNFCINYNGREEIVDACKLIARQVKAEKVEPEMIDKEMIKENLYCSSFLPPDLFIKNGETRQTSGLLLWDMLETHIYFTDKLWPDFTVSSFNDALKDFQKYPKR